VGHHPGPKRSAPDPKVQVRGLIIPLVADPGFEPGSFRDGFTGRRRTLADLRFPFPTRGLGANRTRIPVHSRPRPDRSPLLRSPRGRGMVDEHRRHVHDPAQIRRIGMWREPRPGGLPPRARIGPPAVLSARQSGEVPPVSGPQGSALVARTVRQLGSGGLRVIGWCG